MNRSGVWLLALVLGAGLPGGAAAEPASVDSAGTAIPTERDSLGTAERRALLFSRPGMEPSSEGMTPSLRFSYPRPLLGEVRGPVQLNTFQRTVVAVDRGAYAGMFLGTLGSVMGWWDEDTAFYLMGAGAALGLVQGTAIEITR